LQKNLLYTRGKLRASSALTKTYLSKSSLAFAMCAAALLLGNRWCFADDCPDTKQVTNNIID
jgi:hypothetical protein